MQVPIGYAPSIVYRFFNNSSTLPWKRPSSSRWPPSGGHLLPSGCRSTRIGDVRTHPHGPVTRRRTVRKNGQYESNVLSSKRAQVEVNVIGKPFILLVECPQCRNRPVADLIIKSEEHVT